MAAALVISAEAANAGKGKTTCQHMKEAYKSESCCGLPSKEVGFQIVPDPKTRLALSANPCADKKPKPGSGYDNNDCTEAISSAIEQAGADVTKGYKGGLAVNETAFTSAYWTNKMCPVNVHWHLGAEHRSQGEFDEGGKGPGKAGAPATRRMAGSVRYGFACHKYNANDAKFTTEYKWQHCKDMHVGETYEVHWPHSALGACNTPHQYQYPFYDGVFCNWQNEVHGGITQQQLANAVGVQSQVFVIVNDENYYYPDLIRGMIVDGDFGKDVAAYTGSTTGTTRSNSVCSKYSPITWQVDRKCHLISASTFDKMCADMKQQADDMSADLYAHGARELVSKTLAADNLVDGPVGGRL